MRVRISYAVETEDIIAEVQRLIEQAECKLRDEIGNLHRVRDNADEDSIERMIKQLDKTRKELTRYDQTLEDSSAILQGYFGLLKQREQGEGDADQQTEDG